VGVSRDVVPPGDETAIVTVTARANDGTVLGSGRAVAITASAGDPIGDVVDVGSGRYERTFVAHAPRGTIATVSATVDGVTLAAHPSIYMVNTRAEIGAPFAAGGGCSLPPTADRTSRPGVLFCVLALLAIATASSARAIRRNSCARSRRRTLDM
jgi:hypothetical protein